METKKQEACLRLMRGGLVRVNYPIENLEISRFCLRKQTAVIIKGSAGMSIIAYSALTPEILKKELNFVGEVDCCHTVVSVNERVDVQPLLEGTIEKSDKEYISIDMLGGVKFLDSIDNQQLPEDYDVRKSLSIINTIWARYLQEVIGRKVMLLDTHFENAAVVQHKKMNAQQLEIIREKLEKYYRGGKDISKYLFHFGRYCLYTNPIYFYHYFIQSNPVYIIYGSGDKIPLAFMGEHKDAVREQLLQQSPIDYLFMLIDAMKLGIAHEYGMEGMAYGSILFEIEQIARFIVEHYDEASKRIVEQKLAALMEIVDAKDFRSCLSSRTLEKIGKLFPSIAYLFLDEGSEDFVANSLVSKSRSSFFSINDSSEYNMTEYPSPSESLSITRSKSVHDVSVDNIQIVSPGSYSEPQLMDSDSTDYANVSYSDVAEGGDYSFSFYSTGSKDDSQDYANMDFDMSSVDENDFEGMFSSLSLSD